MAWPATPKVAQPVQDRAREAGRLGDRRVDVQRVRIAAQPVDQRRLRPRRQVADLVGRALGQRMHRRRLARRAAEAAVAAAERGLRRGRDPLAGRLVGRRRARNRPARPCPAPLSMISVTRVLPTTVPRGASGRCSMSPCSPATSFTQSMPVSRSRAQKPGQPSTTAKVGSDLEAPSRRRTAARRRRADRARARGRARRGSRPSRCRSARPSGMSSASSLS